MSKSKDVQMWVALNNLGAEIFIEDAVIGVDYICPNCGGIVRARALDSTCVTEHFYHLQKSDCDGESLLHNYWKHNLIHIGETITLPVVGDVECIDKRVEFSFNTSTGIYQPDLIIKTNNPKYRFIIFEIFNTNKKEIEKYIPKWKELKYTIFEVDAKGLHKNKDNRISQLKLLYSNEKDLFINRTKNKINKLRYLLYNSKYSEDDKSTIYPILMKFKKLFDDDLKKISKSKLNTLHNLLHKQYWNREVYKNLISPLLLLYKELQIYSY